MDADYDIVNVVNTYFTIQIFEIINTIPPRTGEPPMSVIICTNLCLRMKCLVLVEGFIVHHDVILCLWWETYCHSHSTFFPDTQMHIRMRKEFDLFQTCIQMLILAFISETCSQ